MARWFRMYADLVRHPKIARLSDSQFRLWVELLCVAADNDGLIPPLEDLKHVLKRRLDHLSRGLDDLIKASLMTPLDHGYTPHGWSEKQYKSDCSTERARAHREKCNVAATPPDTDTDTEDIPPPKSSPLPLPPPSIPVDAWTAFAEMRRRKRKPLTNRAAKLVWVELDKLAEAGHPPGDVLDQSTRNGWSDVYPLKDKSNERAHSTTESPYLAAARDLMAEARQRRMAGSG